MRARAITVTLTSALLLGLALSVRAAPRDARLDAALDPENGSSFYIAMSMMPVTLAADLDLFARDRGLDPAEVDRVLEAAVAEYTKKEPGWNRGAPGLERRLVDALRRQRAKSLAEEARRKANALANGTAAAAPPRATAPQSRWDALRRQGEADARAQAEAEEAARREASQEKPPVATPPEAEPEPPAPVPPAPAPPAPGTPAPRGASVGFTAAITIENDGPALEGTVRVSNGRLTGSFVRPQRLVVHVNQATLTLVSTTRYTIDGAFDGTTATGTFKVTVDGRTTGVVDENVNPKPWKGSRVLAIHTGTGQGRFELTLNRDGSLRYQHDGQSTAVTKRVTGETQTQPVHERLGPTGGRWTRK